MLISLYRCIATVRTEYLFTSQFHLAFYIRFKVFQSRIFGLHDMVSNIKQLQGEFLILPLQRNITRSRRAIQWHPTPPPTPSFWGIDGAVIKKISSNFFLILAPSILQNDLNHTSNVCFMTLNLVTEFLTDEKKNLWIKI